MSIEAHAVHIENLQKQIAALSEDCESQHKDSLEAIREVHRRIDDFTQIMMRMSEMNKDLQSAAAHIKVIESDAKDFDRRLALVERQSDSNAEMTSGIKKIGLAIVLGFGGLIGTAVWQLILAAPK